MTNAISPSFDVEILEQVPALRRYARRLVQTSDQADDLVQDCFVRALSRTHLYQPGTNLRAWLFSMIRNLAFSQFRTEKLRRDYASGRMSLAPRSTAARQPNLVSLDESLQLLKKLPPSQKQALTMLGVQELSYEEAAECSGLAIGTLKSRLSRGRAHLRALADLQAGETVGLAA